MAQPTGIDLHVDALLSNILIAYKNMDDAFVATRIFPEIPVRRRSNLIAEIRKADFFRDEAVIRAPGTKVPAVGFGVQKDKTYFCKNFASALLIDSETRDNQDEPFDVDRIATLMLSERLNLKKEKLFATKFFKKDVWTTQEDYSGAGLSQWSQFATANPVDDIERNSLAIESTTARIPSDLTIGREVWSKLKQNPLLMEKIKFTQRAVLTTELVAALLELRRINIGRAIEVTSPEGAAADVFAFLFGKHALLSHTPDAPGILVPMPGATFIWNRPNRPGTAYVRRMYLQEEDSDKIEGHIFQDLQTIGADLCAFMENVVS